MSFSFELGMALVAWLVLAVPVAAWCAVMWFFFIRPARRWLPPKRLRMTRISALEVLFIFVGSGLILAGVHDAMRILLGEPSVADKYLRSYVAVLIAFPIFMAFSWAVLQLVSGTPLYQLGLHPSRWKQFTVLGGLVWMIATPLILLVNLVITWIVTQLGQRPEQHTLTQIMAGEQPLLEWTVLIASALLVAPLLEEFLFRGVIQKWSLQKNYHAHVLLIAACVVTVLHNTAFAISAACFALLLVPAYLLCPLWFRNRKKTPSSDNSWHIQTSSKQATSTADEPVTDFKQMPQTESDITKLKSTVFAGEDNAFLGEREERISIAKSQPDPLLQFFDLPGSDPGTHRFRAIYATALLFAGSHPWPTPIPLFILALLLGWLAYRTQSLIAPMTLHLLFNAVACTEVALELFRMAAY